MSRIQWYYAHGEEQGGPVSPQDLKRMAGVGELSPDDLVWREGMEDWAEARIVRGLFDEAAKPAGTRIPPKVVSPPALDEPKASRPSEWAEAPPDLLPPRPVEPLAPTEAGDQMQRPARHPFDLLLDGLRVVFPAALVPAVARVFGLLGVYGLYAAMLAAGGLALVVTFKTDRFGPLLAAVAQVLLLMVLQYAAGRFLESLDRLVRTTTSPIASTAVPDCLALLAIAVGLSLLLGAAAAGISSARYAEVAQGLLAFLLCEYLAIVALYPATLGISIVPNARAGEEAIGLLSFLLKAGLRAVPVAFGAGVLWAVLSLLWANYRVLTDPSPSAAMQRAIEVNGWLVYFAALPVLGYVTFLAYYLLVDVLGAILSLPGKLETLSRQEAAVSVPEDKEDAKLE